MNFINRSSVSGLLILLFVSFQLKVSAYKKCGENYFLFHKWYMEESKVFLIKNENILNLLNDSRRSADQFKVDVKMEDFQSFCRFYNKHADKNETYSPCNDQRYDMYMCFRRFILQLNENLNAVIKQYIEFNSNYVLNELNESLICNHTLNEQTFSINNYYERSCYACIKGLASARNNCSSTQNNTITNKCCLVGKLINLSGKSIDPFIFENIYLRNKEFIGGQHNSFVKNLKPLKSTCSGSKSPDDCVCPSGYSKSDKDCIDDDECAKASKNACTYLNDRLNDSVQSFCINTFGNFVCARISCPTNFKLKNDKCYYNGRLYYELRIDEKFSIPKILAFNFLSLPTNAHIPDGKLELFKIESLSSSADYNYKIHKVNSVYHNMNKISLPYIVSTDLNRDEAGLAANHFSLEYNNDTKNAIIYLHDDIKQPVEAQVIVISSWHSHDKKTFGITNMVLNIFVTN